MTREELTRLVHGATFADLGFFEQGRPSIRRVFCTWHRGLGGHLVSTNTSSRHVQCLLKDPSACLYFEDSRRFEGICLSGSAIVHRDRAHRALLWHDQDTMYYPGGVDDEDYCVIEFLADGARYYRLSDKGDLTRQTLDEWDAGEEYRDCSAKG